MRPTSLTRHSRRGYDWNTTTTTSTMDKSSVEKVYNLLELKDDIAFAHLVKEALDVIEMGLDKYG